MKVSRIVIGLSILLLVSVGCAERGTDGYIPSSDDEVERGKAAGLSYCKATVSHSAGGVGLLNCDDSTCIAENPIGAVHNYRCDDQVCPVKEDVLYKVQCDTLKFLTGCSLKYSPVEECE